MVQPGQGSAPTGGGEGIDGWPLLSGAPDPEPFDPMTYNPRLWEGLPSQTNRYDDTNAGPRKKRHVEGPLGYPHSNAGVMPDGWEEFHHPEGRPYYYNSQLRLVTEMCIRHKGVLERLMAWHASFLILQNHVRPGAAAFDVCLDFSGGDTCRYYMVDHANETISWLRQLTPADLGISDVRSMLHLRALLHEEYWTHVEYMPKNENHLRAALSRVKQSLASCMLDHMTSEGSTSPFTISECRAFLTMLNMAADSGSVVCLNWSIARILGILVHNRNRNVYGRYNTRLSRTVAANQIQPRPLINEGYWRYTQCMPRNNNRFHGLRFPAYQQGIGGVGVEQRQREKGKRKKKVEVEPEKEDTGRRKSQEGKRRKGGQSDHGTEETKGESVEEGLSSPRPAFVQKLRITAETQQNEVVDYFERVIKLNNYTSKLIHDLRVNQQGRGGCASVFRVATTNNKYVATKCIYMDPSWSSSKLLKHTARELEVWSMLRHVNILPLLGLAEYHGCVAMISPWMQLGDVVRFVNDRPDADRYKLSIRVVRAVAYLHDKGIVHGDIKGANVVMSDEGEPMLTDFGLSIMSESSLILSVSGTGGGTWRWMAPEMLDGGSRSKEADVYALGMTILEIFTGRPPFDEIHTLAGIVRTVVCERSSPRRPKELLSPDPVNELVWEAMTKSWTYEKARRATVSEVERIMTRTPNPDGHVQWWWPWWCGLGLGLSFYALIIYTRV